MKDHYGNEQYRKETSDGRRVTGSYGYWGPDGIYRHVDYIADENGYRANIRTSEPGTTNDNPASVRISSMPTVYGRALPRGSDSLPKPTPPPTTPAGGTRFGKEGGGVPRTLTPSTKSAYQSPYHQSNDQVRLTSPAVAGRPRTTAVYQPPTYATKSPQSNYISRFDTELARQMPQQYMQEQIVSRSGELGEFREVNRHSNEFDDNKSQTPTVPEPQVTSAAIQQPPNDTETVTVSTTTQNPVTETAFSLPEEQPLNQQLNQQLNQNNRYIYDRKASRSTDFTTRHNPVSRLLVFA